MAQVNIFDLFDEAAEVYANDLSLDTSGHLEELSSLKQAYFGTNPVDYSSPLRRYVYLRNFAPKHAIVWRTYVRNNLKWRMDARKVYQFNAVGTGPASEVIGILEGIDWNEKSPPVEPVCLETETGWFEAGEIVARLYREKRGLPLKIKYTSSPGDMIKSAYVFGSMVISDLARGGNVYEVLDAIREAVRPAQGLFLDTTVCKLPSGVTAYTSDQMHSIRSGRFVNFREDGIDEVMRGEIEAEIDSMLRGPISGVSTEFSLNIFPVKF